MIRRWTDTDKWSRAHFRNLPLRLKAAWFYILENADKCGFWLPEIEVLNARILAPGEKTPPVTKSEAITAFEPYIFAHVTGVWQIRDWFSLQYTAKNNVRKSALAELTTFSRVLGPQVFILAGLEPARSEADAGTQSGATNRGTDAGASEPEPEPEPAPETEAEPEPETATHPPDSDAMDAATVVMTAREVGLPVTRVAPFTEAALRAACQEFGGFRVCAALRKYKIRFKGDQSLANFADHVDRWIPHTPPDPGRCQHRFQDHVTALDGFRNGDKAVQRVCAACGAKEGPERRSRPDCGHDWHVIDAAVGGSRVGMEVCQLCGVERAPEGVAA